MTRKGYDRFYKEAFFEYLDPYNRPAYVEDFEKGADPKYWTYTRAKIMPYIYGWIKKEGGRVLDIGAGYGTILFHLKRDKNMNCLGIDPDPESVKIAKEKFGIEVQDETIESFFAKSTEKFDLVIMEQTFEHLMDPLWTLKEIKKRLSPEGFVYIGVPNGYKFQAPYSLWFQLAHTYNYTPYSLRKLAELAELRVFDLRGSDLHPLEVLICHPEANYPTERDSVLNVGKNYRGTLWEMRKKKYREGVRAILKKSITSLLGKDTKEKIRKFVDELIRYKY
jgi:2-polyprenyl-3-methyl-5-hydroxy-6-metoxy-1,4-benzoquinol methylase